MFTIVQNGYSLDLLPTQDAIVNHRDNILLFRVEIRN